jgi:hypothetical protein
MFEFTAGEFVFRLAESSIELLSARWSQYNLFSLVERGEEGIVDEPAFQE